MALGKAGLVLMARDSDRAGVKVMLGLYLSMHWLGEAKKSSLCKRGWLGLNKTKG